LLLRCCCHCQSATSIASSSLHAVILVGETESVNSSAGELEAELDVLAYHTLEGGPRLEGHSMVGDIAPGGRNGQRVQSAERGGRRSSKQARSKKQEAKTSVLTGSSIVKSIFSHSGQCVVNTKAGVPSHEAYLDRTSSAGNIGSDDEDAATAFDGYCVSTAGARPNE
jgi:hypothetical protein